MTTFHPTKRCWINQPSKLQPFHHLHGQFATLHNDTFGKSVQITLGDNPDKMTIDRAALSPGHPIYGKISEDDVRFWNK